MKRNMGLCVPVVPGTAGTKSIRGSMAALALAALGSPAAFATLAALTLLAALASVSAPVRAATPGDLDPAFAGSGYVTQSQGDFAAGSAVIADFENRVVTAYSATNNAPGSFYEYSVVRYLDNGALDASFGAGGIVNLPLPSKDLFCNPELVEDSSTNLLVASCNADTIFVWRLKNDGSLDATYGSGGLASITVGGPVYPVLGLTQYKDRAMIATNSYAPGATRPRFTLVRLTNAGAPDASLAGSGIARYDILPGTVSEWGGATSVKMDTSNRIVLGGRVRSAATPNYHFALARLSWTGTLDASFGTAGVTSFPILSGPNYGRRLGFDPAGRILLSGTVCFPFDPVTGDQPCYVGLARLLANGTLDTSLTGGTGTMAYGGGGGPANPSAGFCTHYTYNYGMTTYKDYIYLVGSCNLLPFSTTPVYPRSTVAYVLRLDGNGQYDTTFGYTMNGYTYYDYRAPEAQHLSVAIDRKARILAAGYAGKTASDTEAYAEVVTARMGQ